jgi:hypothetical protein
MRLSKHTCARPKESAAVVATQAGKSVASVNEESDEEEKDKKGFACCLHFNRLR